MPAKISVFKFGLNISKFNQYMGNTDFHAWLTFTAKAVCTQLWYKLD